MSGERVRGLCRDLIDAAKAEPMSRDEFQSRKIRLCHEYRLDEVPPNSAVLACADPDERKMLEHLLVKKPMRTMSGVAAVAVMTSPHPCPHGKCTY
ncbi:MAG: tRNA uridine(34) 5-carboxymethylaminomethyl modification radical SAM/GNAT enzyme Elp3, partial [Candidatus Methanoplasma sp.]|nr:tRNA uridine(34) 5-carboxymethylaminomethyl modification radical SAM/GNAT enzyme Elp3 [Candidatus Methanoplasma sp.]